MKAASLGGFVYVGSIRAALTASLNREMKAMIHSRRAASQGCQASHVRNPLRLQQSVPFSANLMDIMVGINKNLNSRCIFAFIPLDPCSSPHLRPYRTPDPGARIPQIGRAHV